MPVTPSRAYLLIPDGGEASPLRMRFTIEAIEAHRARMIEHARDARDVIRWQLAQVRVYDIRPQRRNRRSDNADAKSDSCYAADPADPIMVG